MKKTLCFQFEVFTNSFRAKRMVFVDEKPKGEPEQAEGSKEQPEKTLEDLKAEAEGALKDATSEMDNIEKKFKLPKNATDKQVDDAAKNNKVLDKVKDNYKMLRDAAKDLRDYLKLTAGKQEAVKDYVQLTFAMIDAVFISLANPEKNELKGVPLYDPMSSDIGEDRYIPLRTERTAIILPSEIKRQAEAQELALTASTFDKIYNGSDFSKEEAKVLLNFLDTQIPKGRYDGQAKDGTFFIIDVATDKKSVRIQKTEKKDATPGIRPGLKEYSIVTTQSLGPDKGAQQFKTPSEMEKDQNHLEANKTEFGKQVDWLKSDKTPIGSMVFLSSEKIKRRNFDTNKDDEFVVNMVVKKASDGKLYMATLETPIINGKTDSTKVKERNITPYDADKAIDLVNTQKDPVSLEANQDMQLAEVKAGLDKLGGNLARCIIFGRDSALYKNYREQLTANIQKNQKLLTGPWSYTWKELNVTVSYDPSKKEVAVVEPDRSVPQTAGSDKRYASFDKFTVENKATA